MNIFSFAILNHFYIIKSMKKWLPLVCFSVFFGIAPSVFAEIEHGNSLTHNADQIFRENVTITTQEFSSEGVYNRDVVLLAKEALMNGYIEGDLLAATQEIEIRGEVEGDVRVIGGSVLLNGIIHGDVLVFGGEVRATEDSVILGEGVVLGGRFIHEGIMQDEVKIISGKVTLGGSFSEEVTVTTQDLILNEELILNPESQNSYFAPREALTPAGLEGLFEYNKTRLWYKNADFQSSSSLFFGFWTLLKFVTNAVLIFLLYFIFKRFVESVKKLGSEKWLRSGVVGVVAFLAFPALALLLMVSLIGLPIGVLLMLIFWSLLIVRISLASFVVSYWLPGFWKKMSGREYEETQYGPVVWAIVALALLTIVGYIPYIGSIVVNVITLIALGTTLIVLYKNIFRRS